MQITESIPGLTHSSFSPSLSLSLSLSLFILPSKILRISCSSFITTSSFSPNSSHLFTVCSISFFSFPPSLFLFNLLLFSNLSSIPPISHPFSFLHLTFPSSSRSYLFNLNFSSFLHRPPHSSSHLSLPLLPPSFFDPLNLIYR